MAKASEVPIRPVPTMAIVVNGSSGQSQAVLVNCAAVSLLEGIFYTIGCPPTLGCKGERLPPGGQGYFSDIRAHDLVVGLPRFGETGSK